MNVPISYSDAGWARYLSMRVRSRHASDSLDRLRRLVAGSSSADRVLLLNSGRAALMTALGAMSASGDGRRVVVVPAYVCPSVVSAVQRLGLVPRFAPVDSDLNMITDALTRCLAPDVLAVVAVHTYGFPADVGQIERIVDGRNVLVVDDAAHCIPGDPTPGAPGTRGAAGIFSFAMSKAVSNGYSGRGGILLLNDQSLSARAESLCRGLGVCATSAWDDLYFVATCLWEPVFARLPWSAQSRIQRALARRSVDPWVPARMSSADAALALEQLRTGAADREVRAARIRTVLAAVPDGPAFWFPHRARPDRLTRLAVCLRPRLSAERIRRLGADAGMTVRVGYDMPHGKPLPFGTLIEIPLGAAWSAARLTNLASALGSIRME
ncbi:MAG: hypothetical protein BroJett024_43960 [Alphaproteobacteria bacterium]|nr:MAG: hypothetical protein BroJett024_43960 [Alphaproteobacteria bacterium]